MSTEIDTERQFVALPYWLTKDHMDKDLPERLYRQLEADDILADLFHERFMSEEEFVKFFTNPDTTLGFVFMEMGADPKFLGLAWLTDVSMTDCFTKAQAGFAFFKKYRDPNMTDFCGHAFLEQAFYVMNIDIVWGITPASNHAAQGYCRRLGFKYEATMKDMTCRRGEITDAMVCVLRKTEYRPKE